MLSGEEGLELVVLVLEALEFIVIVEFAAVEDVLDLAETDLLHLLNALFFDELNLELALGFGLRLFVNK